MAQADVDVGCGRVPSFGPLHACNVGAQDVKRQPDQKFEILRSFND